MQSLCDHPQYQLNHLLDPKLQQQIQQQQQPPQPPQPQQQQRRPQQQQKQLQQQQQKQQQQETHQPQQPPQPQQQQQQQHQPQQQQQQQQKAHQPQHIQQTDIVKRRYKSKLRRSPMCRGTRPVITHNHHNHRHQDNNNEEQDEDDEEEEIVFDRRPSMCLLLEPETILLFRLAGMKLKPSQQERLYWNLLRLLNYLESEGKEMASSFNNGSSAYYQGATAGGGGSAKEIKRTETFDGGGYGFFWDEYHSIEQSSTPHNISSSSSSSASLTILPDSEDGLVSRDDKNEREIQWLNDVGFTNIAKKIRARHEIDQNDDDLKIIAASLTRAQANAVRRRIDSLNEAIRQRTKGGDSSLKLPSHRVSSSKQRRHVKDIFKGSDSSPLSRKQSGKKIQKDASWIRPCDRGLHAATTNGNADKQSSGSPPVVPPKPPPRDGGRHSRNQSESNSDLCGSSDEGTVVNGFSSTTTKNQESRSEITTNGDGCERNSPSASALSTPQTPQIDNLVRRTSANKLVILTGEERKKILSASSATASMSTATNYVDEQQQQRDEAENHHLVPRKSSSIKKRETFDSAYLRPTVVDRSSNNENNTDTNNRLSLQDTKLRRRHSDVPEGKREEKRLVVVDSTYINVSSVGDGYAKMKTPQQSTQRNSFKNEESENRQNQNSDSEWVVESQSQSNKRNSLKNRETKNLKNDNSESEWTAVAITSKYRTDDESLKPFDSSIDATLPSNISDSYTKERPSKLYYDSSKEGLPENYSSRNNIGREDGLMDTYASVEQFYPQREQVLSDSYAYYKERLQDGHTSKEVHISDSYDDSSASKELTAGSRRRHLDSVETTTTSSSLNASNLSLLTSSNSSLPSNFSAEDELHFSGDAMSNLSLSTEHLPKSTENLSTTTATHTDGHAHSSHSGSRAKNKKTNKNEKDKQHKEKKKHKHKKHHKHHKDEVEDPLESLARNTKSFESPTTGVKVQPSVQTMGRWSDDSKSIDSFDSLEDFQQPSASHRAAPKNQYYSSSDSNRTTPDKSLDSDLPTTSRTQSPQCLEGDAKLNVGPTMSSPRGLDQRTPPVDGSLLGPNFPKLPNFTLTKEELGLTHIGDLSEVDMMTTRRLALIELTALFDNCGVPMNNRRKPNVKLKFKDNGTFGLPLAMLCAREESKHNPDVKIPKILRELIRYLEKYGLSEEGLLRVPGSAQRVKLLREEADKNPSLNTLEWEGRKVTDIATCLKQFLRDLPEPLLTYEYQNTFTSVADIPDRKHQLQALNLLVVLLPPIHQECLRALLVFLSKVAANEGVNKMGLNNVAMIIAPNLFFQNNAIINISEAKKAAGMTDVLRMLIKYQVILWTIPSFMVSQIRFLNEAGAKTKDPKALNKIIKRRRLDSPSHPSNPALKMIRPGGGSNSGDELEEFDENLIIRVKAPTLNKQSMAIQLSTQTTVAEVVSKFQWQRQKSNKEKDEIDTNRLRIKPKETQPRKQDHELALVNLYLYEVGGNIGERRLDSSACISAILRENPNAEWMLKSEMVFQ